MAALSAAAGRPRATAGTLCASLRANIRSNGDSSKAYCYLREYSRLSLSRFWSSIVAVCRAKALQVLQFGYITRPSGCTATWLCGISHWAKPTYD